ncbi:MAG: ubiquitin-like protein Pup [Micrococcales bacterium]|nr:ubiquitin-like protein Pup [Micrococcales bacterium]
MEQIKGSASSRRRGEDQAGGEPGESGANQTQAQAGTQAIDDLLDSIDEVLETNAEAFVRSFVQKGGQ